MQTYGRLKGQGIFSLDKNKILRLQVTLDSPHAKNVSISQTALFLFTYTRMKFLIFNKFCQSASLLNFKGKKISDVTRWIWTRRARKEIFHPNH